MNQRQGAPPSVVAALDRAFELAALGPAHGPNPRVGCVIVAPDGAVIAEGFHEGAGRPHAEAVALAAAKRPVTGATAVVTLEPCAHTGRTPPCAEALAAAGIGRVVYAAPDPNPLAKGGAARLAARGVSVIGPLDPDRARAINPAWTFAVENGRPLVILKTAATLDGRIAAADGTSRWITSPEARAHAHRVRAGVDAIIVGTGTVLADDPTLTARPPGPRQPLRVAMGLRGVPAEASVRSSDGGEFLHARTRDPGDVLALLQAREVRAALVEGGAQVAGAFLRAGLVDRVHAYIEPMFLGAGTLSAPGLGIATLADAPRWAAEEALTLGPTVFINATRRTERT